MGIMCRPNKRVDFNFADWKCLIHCYPQQKWEQIDFDDEEKTVDLSYKNIRMTISQEHYEKYFYVL